MHPSPPPPLPSRAKTAPADLFGRPAYTFHPLQACHGNTRPSTRLPMPGTALLNPPRHSVSHRARTPRRLPSVPPAYSRFLSCTIHAVRTCTWSLTHVGGENKADWLASPLQD
ncbi:hypothetical protein ACJQWK_07616 [Exserohilum turcicum]